jgi:serine/threonine protein kinase/tetratricopeptide (TPR) repeat protein
VTVPSGTKLGRFEIRSKIGEGGMGEVYLAQDTKLNRKVALKVLPGDIASDKERLLRFEREAHAVSALNHPNIITIHEIGESDGGHFIATEFIDGTTLGDRLADHPLALSEILAVATQIARAIQAAHEAGIVHRDIKPGNVMLRRDGYVKVLDFGIAKLTEHTSGSIDSEADTIARMVNTEPGKIMGTTHYMAPEQVRNQTIDARTDIWSLGVLLYEMIAGRKPFLGETFGDLIAAILTKEPPAVSELAPECPAELERIVVKALQKDRKQRYQHAKDLSSDLKVLRRRLDFEAELERSATADHGDALTTAKTVTSATLSTGPVAATEGIGATGQIAATDIHTTSSAEYLFNEFKKHRRGVFLVLIPLVVAVAVLVYFAAFRTRLAPLTDKDTILLADIENTTGDPVFDGALKQGLAVTLGQSPFLDIFPEARVRETLQLMQRGPDQRVSEAVAREICQRQGLKAFLSGSIAPLGSHYVIMLKAVSAQSGYEIAREQTEADSKEHVLTALSQAAIKLREQLGESLSSIQKFDAPVEQATTASLDALKAYSLGLEQANSGNYPKAIPFYQRAIELDPNFALGYQALAREQLNNDDNNAATVSATRAFELRERASENEKLYITIIYHRAVTHDLGKAIEGGEVWKHTYPRYWRPYHALADLYLEVGEFEKAAENGREAVRLNPKIAAAYSNYAGALMYLNRFDEAKQIYQQAFRNNLDAREYHWYLYWIAYHANDATAMQQQLTWAETNSLPYWSLFLQAQRAALEGKWRKSIDLSNRATEMIGGGGTKGLVAWTASHSALTAALFGDCRSAKQKAAQALESVPDATYAGSAAVLAMCGEVNQAQAQADKLARLYPNDTRFNGIWLPVIRAAIELQRNNPARAIQFLEPALRYEAAADFQPQYWRGLSYLRLGQGPEAAAEFQKIVDRKGQADLLVSTLCPLARLGLARALSFSGDAARARKAYEDFFALWRDADNDLPILIEAKNEYAKTK